MMGMWRWLVFLLIFIIIFVLWQWARSFLIFVIVYKMFIASFVLGQCQTQKAPKDCLLSFGFSNAMQWNETKRNETNNALTTLLIASSLIDRTMHPFKHLVTLTPNHHHRRLLLTVVVNIVSTTTTTKVLFEVTENDVSMKQNMVMMQLDSFCHTHKHWNIS